MYHFILYFITVFFLWVLRPEIKFLYLYLYLYAYTLYCIVWYMVEVKLSLDLCRPKL